MNMKITTIIARSLVGLIFVVFGSNMFLHFIPMPPPPEGPARDFMTALYVSHYLYVVAAFEVAGGLLLFTGRWAPLGLALLGPVIVNILAFHVLMSSAGLGMATVVSALVVFLVWRYRENFAGLVRPPQHAQRQQSILEDRSQPAAAANS
jgi:putative oxidoreductase